MENSKWRLLSIPHETILRSSQCPSTKSELERMNGIPYAYVNGSIIYVILCMRLYISYDLSMMSRYQQNPGEGHWIAVKNILKY